MCARVCVFVCLVYRPPTLKVFLFLSSHVIFMRAHSPSSAVIMLGKFAPYLAMDSEAKKKKKRKNTH